MYGQEVDPDLCHSLISGVVSAVRDRSLIDPSVHMRTVSSKSEEPQEVASECWFVFDSAGYE